MKPEMKPHRVKTVDFATHLELIVPTKCPVCGSDGLSPLGDAGGDAYEFEFEIGHPPGFGKVPFLAAMCPCCAHIVWFLKDAVGGWFDSSSEESPE